MMKICISNEGHMQSQQLIESLIESTRIHINFMERMNSLPDASLTQRISDKSWSVLECVEHLNRYNDFYLPEFKRRIESSAFPADASFSSGFLGGYFAKSMLPKEKLNKMKTFKDKDPIFENIDRSVIEKFIQQQKELLTLLEKARSVSLNKTKVSISISKWIRLKLGDALLFFVNHITRHHHQMERIIGVGGE
ncbi:MAG: DinB family protein [Flavobacteriales bacterium]|jgi:uncharacterized damage-inducible protein DinB